ncbi:PPOX class F420-dependent oxidoreductase [Arsenicicoccus sp. oral taxon 190]|uniref:PPOX class F420-dependent oxidoreductase n=1 Tax=Arsenicicoccus sp. oral taxon 190 TaxID=1658671 RepID=UPI000679F8DA|nr:PPOX class F420-dependent oxidoreductase [Arsenicicoccus sp. oral taxon 190]AKT50155.1 hypothetical protein ADJ73_00300 [Arsenicicoccus sp. oral taxon 190]
MPTPTLTALAHERFVSLTTSRRDGRGVATPVWVARDGDALVVITPEGTGKLKRLRHTSRVTLRPCDRRGRVAPDAPTVEGTATVSDDPWTVSRVREILAAKYGLEFRVFMAIERILKRGNPSRAVITIR